jgi:hypothetical protein
MVASSPDEHPAVTNTNAATSVRRRVVGFIGFFPLLACAPMR